MSISLEYENEHEPIRLDLASFKDNREVVQPLLDFPVLASLTTATFSELGEYYKMRREGTLPKNQSKPVSGMMLEFSDLKHFISGIPTASHPENIEIDQEYTGFGIDNNKLFVCNRNHIELFENGIRKTIEHPLFNDLHFINFSQDGKSMLVSSSGIEAILEFTYPEMKLNWSWLASEHGYSNAPDGTTIFSARQQPSIQESEKVRVIDLKKDYSKAKVETSSQAAHINTATYANESGNLIATTIFQTGEAILINKGTGEVRSALRGLHDPHGFFRFGLHNEHYVVTSARTGVIDIVSQRDLSHEFRIDGEIKRYDYPTTWLQNTFPISGNVLASINHWQRRVVFFDPFKKEKFIVETPNEWKIFQLSLINQAKSFIK